MDGDDWQPIGSVVSKVMEKVVQVWERPELSDEIWQKDERADPEDEDGSCELIDNGELWDEEN